MPNWTTIKVFGVRRVLDWRVAAGGLAAIVLFYAAKSTYEVRGTLSGITCYSGRYASFDISVKTHLRTPLSFGLFPPVCGDSYLVPVIGSIEPALERGAPIRLVVRGFSDPLNCETSPGARDLLRSLGNSWTCKRQLDHVKAIYVRDRLVWQGWW